MEIRKGPAIVVEFLKDTRAITRVDTTPAKRKKGTKKGANTTFSKATLTQIEKGIKRGLDDAEILRRRKWGMNNIPEGSREVLKEPLIWIENMVRPKPGPEHIILKQSFQYVPHL